MKFWGVEEEFSFEKFCLSEWDSGYNVLFYLVFHLIYLEYDAEPKSMNYICLQLERKHNSSKISSEFIYS